MLQELHIKNLALIDEATLDLDNGFTVFTGETGAGKTVLMGALKLLLGERGDSSLIKRGESTATIEGRFLINNVEYVVSRTISHDGRNKCYINGIMSTLTNLSNTLSPYVEIHGQHEHQMLLNPQSHITYLDAFIGEKLNEVLSEYRKARDKRNQIATKHKKLIAARNKAEKEKSFIEFQLNEIKSTHLVENEDEQLNSDLPKLRHGEKLSVAAAAVEGIINSLMNLDIEQRTVINKVDGLDSELDALIRRYEQEKISLKTLGDEINNYLENISFDATKLNNAENRLIVIDTLKRKYGASVNEILKKAEELQIELDLLESGETTIEQTKKELIDANKKFKEKANQLNEFRETYFQDFSKKVLDVMKPLALPEAQFTINATPLPPEEWNENGAQQIEFLFTANRGEVPQSLSKIASGGEISRVMLAIKSILGSRGLTNTMVFDEIDTGIGGVAGNAIGKQMRLLGNNQQIFAITHLGQVASYAHHHYTVSKSFKNDGTKTIINKLDNRIEEITRMLSGKDTENSRKHAEELLLEAQGE